jgi:hypothetical protein
MRRALAAGLLAATLAVPTAARAEFEGAGIAHYEGSYVQHGSLERDTAPGTALGLARLRIRGIAPWRRGPAIGLDLAVGTTYPGGFAYDVGLHLLGVGTRIGDFGSAGVIAGLGASGAVGTIDDAATAPVVAWLELPLGKVARLLVHARGVWVLGGADGRGGGSPSQPVFDELEAMAALRLGKQYDDWGMSAGNGWFLGAALREAGGERFVGGVLGYSIDVAGGCGC